MIKVSKGATKVVLALCHNAHAIEGQVMGVNDELASRGFRSLGVAATRPNTNKCVVVRGRAVVPSLSHGRAALCAAVAVVTRER